MNLTNESFSTLDAAKGITPLPEKHGEEMALPAWHRSVYHVPLKLLTLGDLARAARQNIHLDEVVQIIIEYLQNDILAGDMFDGELLSSLHSISSKFWRLHIHESRALRDIIQTHISVIPAELLAEAQEILAKTAI